MKELGSRLMRARETRGLTLEDAERDTRISRRYLQALDFKLVNEALHERELLLATLAPHLGKPVSFLYPLTKKYIERPYVAAGITLYDVMARLGAKATSPFHRHHTLAGVQKLAELRYQPW